MHDIGKSQGDRSVRFVDRAAKVILGGISPGLLRRVARRPTVSWSAGIALAVHHPAFGAQLAKELGCNETVCWLIHYHKHTEENDCSLLEALRLAHSAC